MRTSLRTLLVILLCGAVSAPAAAQNRPTVGVAFGGGSARGIAHVGVIKWFEEHRIPIDMAAGTSMGGLIGGGFATGLDAAGLDALLQSLNWDELFGPTSFKFKNIRRKADALAYPSRLEFGLKGGIVPPPSLNNGAQIDLLVGRLAAPYYAAATFDDLPTPFKTVAMDLLTAKPVILDRGSLATALRATMSLPLIFPPVRRDGYVLVDGGAMNNIPADVVKAMGATKVVAVNVGDLTDRGEVNESMFGLAGSTIDAMMRANTRVGIRQADVIINVPLADYGSLDWRRSTDLINEGYKAAESMKDSLLPLAVNETEYAAWKAARQARVKTALPPPAFVRVEGFSSGDTRSVDKLLEHHVGQPFDVEALQTELSALSGLDRYQSVTWSLVPGASGETGLLVQAHPKTYAPPFLMLGINLENTTSDSFNLSVGARYLGYDMVGPRSELRVDGTVGSDPALGIELYKPIGPGAFFVAPFAGITNRTHNVVVENEVVASYGSTLSAVGLNLGLNLGRISDLRVGAHVGRLSADVKVGDPGLPAIKGSQTVAEAAWRYNSLDSPAVPSLGSYARATLRYVFDGPDIDPPLQTGRSSVKLTQLFGEDVTFWTWRNRHRLFALGGGGTSFNDEPLPTDQFALGAPFHLGAYGFGEIRGDHYYVLTLGYLRQLGRLPDFLGGTISAGGWLENGDAFNSWDDVGIRTHASAGVIMDTLIGPVILAGSAGFDGRFRFYLGVGRIYGGNR